MRAMIKIFFKKNLYVILSSALFIAFMSQRFYAVFATIFTFFIIIWIIFSFFLTLKNQNKRKDLLTKILILISSIITVFCIHEHRSSIDRITAENIATLVKKYKEDHGVYPVDLDTIGLNGQRLKEDLMLRYWFTSNDNVPLLVYASTWMPVDKFYYDFQNNVWVFHSE